jgi:hypothetical protein
MRAVFTDNGRHTVEIFNLSGRRRLKRTGFQAEEQTFPERPPGVYQVRISAPGKAFVKRVAVP